MRVALVTDWYHPRIGGIELHLRDLARHLSIAGHDVVVITPTPGPDRVDDVRVRRIEAPRAPRFGFLCTPSGVRAVGAALSEERADVAHCHVSIVSPAALGGASEAHRRGVPTVITFHSIVPQTRLLARAMRAFLRTGRWHARYSAVSHRVAREVAPLGAGQAVSVLPNGVDAEWWKPDGAPASDGSRFHLLSVMRLNAKKRPLALVRLVRRLRDLVPRDQRIRLRIAGDGPQRGAVERAVRHAGLEGSIELLGHCTRERIRELHAESDVFVLPSLRESFGLAALEARCAGLPVVAMASSGVAELIAHGQEGLLAHSDAELAAHVSRLARDPGLRHAIADHNRRSTPPFDWRRTIDAHVDLYRGAIALRDSVWAETKK